MDTMATGLCERSSSATQPRGHRVRSRFARRRFSTTDGLPAFSATWCFAALVIGLFAASAASAEAAPDAAGDRRPWFQDTVEVKLGVVFTFVDTDLDIPPRVDLESDLDLDDFAVEPAAGVLWRFTRNKKHRFGLHYFSMLRSAKETLGFELDLPNLPPIPIGIETETDFDLHILSLTYGYSFLQDQKKELGLFGGLDFIFNDTRISAQVPGIGEIEGDLVDDKFTVPFPTLGAYWNWAFAERFAFRSRFQVFGLDVGDIQGALFKGSLGVQHDTFRHVNFYLGYELLGATAGVDGTIDDFSFFSHGPALAVVLRF